MGNRSLTLASVEAGKVLLRYLRAHPTGSTFKDLTGALRKANLKHCSEETARRGLKYLRDYHDAPIVPVRADNTWELEDPEFRIPLVDPTQTDLASAIFAAAVLEPMASLETRVRIERMVEMMDLVVRQRGEDAKVRRTTLTASITTGMPADAQIVAVLAEACAGSRVVEIDYYSPWSDERKRYTIEPWQLRVHDGAMYVRAHSLQAGEARTFRVVQIRSLHRLEGSARVGKRPPREEIWGDTTGVGVDDDRPDIATVRIKGSFARWVELECWHESQEDRWSSDMSVLERRMEYRSCREFARRLLSLGDALLSVEPRTLQEEVTAHARALVARVASPQQRDL